LQVEPGNSAILAGGSLAQIELQGKFTLK